MHFYRISFFYNLTIFLLFTLAFSSLFGWLFDLKLFTSFSLTMPSMSIFTATSFILSALGLMSIRSSDRDHLFHRAVKILLALSMAGLAIISLAISLNAWSCNWSDFLPIEKNHTLIFISSPLTSLALLFSAISIGLLGTKIKARHEISQLCALFVLTIMLLSLISYLSSATHIYQLNNQVGISFPTTFGLFFLSGSLFFAFPQLAFANAFLKHSTSAAAQRHLLPATIIIPLLMLFISYLLQYSHLVKSNTTNEAINSFITILTLVGFTVYLRKYIASIENQFDIMANAAPVMMWIADTQGHTFFFNDKWLTFTGRNLEDEQSTDFTQCIHPDDLLNTINAYTEAFKHQKSFTIEYRLKHHEDQYRTILENGSPYQNTNGEFEGIIGSCVDITENKQLQVKLEENNKMLNAEIIIRKNLEKEMENLAFYDPLTTLANRRLLLERMKQEIIVAKRHHHYGAIIFFDLDNFKSLNDTYGHQAGDELLIQVATRIRLALREEDTPCRVGGDEFVVLIASHEMTVTKSREYAIIIAEKIRESIATPFILKELEYSVSASIGVTLYSEFNDQIDEILQQADTAMYQSKKDGRNTVSFYELSKT